jgi:hypothetical protein
MSSALLLVKWGPKLVGRDEFVHHFLLFKEPDARQNAGADYRISKTTSFEVMPFISFTAIQQSARRESLDTAFRRRFAEHIEDVLGPKFDANHPSMIRNANFSPNTPSHQRPR